LPLETAPLWPITDSTNRFWIMLKKSTGTEACGNLLLDRNFKAIVQLLLHLQ
jgi:hypothetical protein